MEKRNNSRFPWQWKAKILNPQTKTILVQDARLNNVSRHGFSILTDEKINRGELYEFLINANSSELRLKARIVHLKKETVYYIGGAKIEESSLWQRCKFNRLLATRYPRIQTSFFLYSLFGGLVVWGLADTYLKVGGFRGFVFFILTTLILYFFPPF